MGQIKNIKLHIVTDIKLSTDLSNKQYALKRKMDNVDSKNSSINMITCCNKLKSHGKMKMCIGLLFVLGIASVGGALVLERMFQSMVKKQLVLKEGTQAFEAWREAPTPVYMTYYLFNYTNADAVVKNWPNHAYQRLDHLFTGKLGRMKFLSSMKIELLTSRIIPMYLNHHCLVQTAMKAQKYLHPT